jgi:hypothetical protein
MEISAVLNGKKYTMVYLRASVKTKKELRGLSPQMNYTNRATAACQQS